jgi:hypothetical protein
MPSAAELEASGFTREDFETDPVEVWPENWRAVCLFCDLRTQFRVGGMGSATGLDYNVLFRKMDRMSLTAEEYDQMEEDVRSLEYAALPLINKQE